MSEWKTYPSSLHRLFKKDLFLKTHIKMNTFNRLLLFGAFIVSFTPIKTIAQLAPPLLIYKNGSSLITGTWDVSTLGGGTIANITTETPYEGGQHLRFKDYKLVGYWDGFGLNLDNWGSSTPLNFATRTHLRIAYRGLSAGHVLQIRLKDNALGNLIDVGEPSSTYKVVDIPLAQLGVGLNLKAITEIDISVGGAATGTGTVYVDAIEVVSKSAVIYKNGFSLITGTWAAQLSETTAEAPYEGGQHYRFKDYVLSGFWAGFGLNLDDNGASSPLNFSTKTHLRIAYRGLTSGHILQVKLRDRANQFGTNVDVGESSATYKVVDIPLAQLGVGVNLQAISEIDLSIGGAETGTGTVYVDAIELIGSASIIYKNGISLVQATWGAGVAEIATENPYEGGQHYRFKDYVISGYWAGFGLNLDNNGVANPIDFTGKTHLRLAYRGLSAGQIFQVKLRDRANQFGTNVDVGEPSATYKVVDVPLSQLSVGVNLQAISEIDISIGGVATGTGTVYVDAIELVSNSATGTTTSVASQRAARMGIGTNAASWLEAFWNFPANYPLANRYTEQDFRNYAAYGFKTIRLPIIFEYLTDRTKPYTLNTAHPVFTDIDNCITWANRYNLNLIIDNHHRTPEASDANFTAVTPITVAIWQQLIQRYGYLNPEKFFFELYNEPNGISNANIKSLLQATVTAIRNTGDKHTLIVGGSSWNAGTSLNSMGTLADTNLIYTFHSYDPFRFCNQGFDWDGNGIPDIAPAGIVFPENAAQIATIKASFAAVKDWSTQNNVPIFLGEFGVSSFADATSRCNWIQMMGEILDANQIPACYWDTKYSNQAYGFFRDEMVLQGNIIPCFATALHLSYAASILPVDLLNFKARPLSKTVQLDWQTASEKNAARFDVERSVDGQVFDKIGELKACGNSAALRNYSFTDIQPINGANYYRLRQIDVDGTAQLSNINTVQMTDKGTISIAPNPAKDHFTLNLSQNDRAIIQIFDLLGRLVLTKTMIGNTANIDISFLPPSHYVIEVKNDKQLFRTQLVKN